MKIIFAGTPDIAVLTLETLILDNSIEVCCVITNPDKPIGRGMVLEKSPVKRVAEKYRIKVWAVDKFSHNFYEAIRFYNADLLVVFAYGKIFSTDFLKLFKFGGVNIHPSLLPKYRGPAPIQATILNLDRESGITIQTLDEKMDCGDILYRETFLLTGKETTASLSDYVSNLAAPIALKVLKNYDKHFEYRIKQSELDEHISYCKKIEKKNAVIDWNFSAEIINAKIRAYSTWPKAVTFFKYIELYILEAEVIKNFDDKDLFDRAKVGEVFFFDKKNGFFIKTGSGILSLKMLQLKSRNVLDWISFKNGNPNFLNSILGDIE